MKKGNLWYVLISYVIAFIVGYVVFTYFNDKENLLLATLLGDVAATIVIFICSILINNSSMYDPYWSVIPLGIVILWVIELKVALTFEVILILLSVSIWAIRLTMNWITNWDGLKEDWRYVGFRNKFKSFYWLISFLAIHFFPTSIVFVGMIPLYYALTAYTTLSTVVVIIGFIICIIAVMCSMLADIALMKHRNSPLKDTSIRIGIWKYSRHPNYFGEIFFWFGCYIFALSRGLEYYYTGIGFVFMVLLFEFYSIPAMEKKLLKTKSDYENIRKSVSRLIPMIKRGA